MGLRFRKSVTLCKGVRLNFGKTGASITLGQKGYHKTISTSGRVTTSIGIPGTGVYWTDTQQIGGRNRNTRNNNSGHRNVAQNTERQRPPRTEESVPVSSRQDEIESTVVRREDTIEPVIPVANSTIEPEVIEPKTSGFTYVKQREWDRDRYEESQKVDYEVANDEMDFFMDPLIKIRGADTVVEAGESLGIRPNTNYIKKDSLYEIYVNCDDTILWRDIQLGNSAEDLYMDIDTWKYCRNIANQITAGDIDAYLDAISELAPVDDLLWYGSDFEFGTDNSSYIETEFVIYPEELLKNGENDELLPAYIQAVSLRVARDLFALLPVDKVVVHVSHKGSDLFSGVFERSLLNSMNFENRNIETLMEKVKFVTTTPNSGNIIRRLMV